ncbi:MAG: hypothetical protein R6V49_01345 [Bacteroidales bacterium]
MKKLSLQTASTIKGVRVNGFPFFLLVIFALLFMAAAPEGHRSDTSGCMTRVDLRAAHTMYSHYSATLNPSDRAHFPAFSVNNCQVDAMKQIFRQNPSAVACRIYPGFETENAGTMYMLVIGVDLAGRDLDTFAYKTAAEFAGFCPPLCDGKSPLASGIASDSIPYNIGEPLSVVNASKLIANYREMNLQTTGGIKHFKISREQFLIMDRLSAGSSEIKGFRLYFGTEGIGKATVLLIASMGSGGIDLESPVYPSSLTNAGLCPYYCDRATEIETGN